MGKLASIVAASLLGVSMASDCFAADKLRMGIISNNVIVNNTVNIGSDIGVHSLKFGTDMQGKRFKYNNLQLEFEVQAQVDYLKVDVVSLEIKVKEFNEIGNYVRTLTFIDGYAASGTSYDGNVDKVFEDVETRRFNYGFTSRPTGGRPEINLDIEEYRKQYQKYFDDAVNILNGYLTSEKREGGNLRYRKGLLMSPERQKPF